MKKDKHLTLGLVLVLLSTLTYGVELYFELAHKDNSFSGLFILHYIVSIIYLVLSKQNQEHFWRFFQKENLSAHIIILILFNISAYSLNLSLPVFNESTDWLVAFLFIENAVLLGYAMLDTPSKRFQYIICFTMTISLIFNIYQTLMILPASPMGLFGALFFGIALLLFVPIFYLVCIISLFKSMTWTLRHRVSACFGLALTLSIVSYFCISWHQTETIILGSKLTQDAPFMDDQGLPDWITIAQSIDDSALTEKYLKTGLVYQEFSNYDGKGISSIWSSSFEDAFVHDPLISVASIFMKKNTLNEQTKIKILNYLYDARHQTTDRFWSGENLSSKQIVTNVELFPEERLSFTEQIITINNDRNARSRWRSQQEALYTFDLPEGGVVTSLSLWIEGQEQKAILTSKSKAQKAYNTIVGKEMRDPSVVYWMEGNQIRVRVFPCTPTEDRKFKLGITAPLQLDGEELTYHSIGFKGPDYSKAISAIHVVMNDAQIIDTSLDLEESTMYQTWKGSYNRDWHLTIAKPQVPNSSFSFDNEHFGIEQSTLDTRAYSPQKVYLDVSSTWTKKELTKIAALVKGKEVFAFTTHLKRKKSSREIIQLSEMKLPLFTLFPFHLMDSDQSMVITKGGNATPNLSDLKGSTFKDKLFAYLKGQSKSPLVIDIGTEASDYMKSLHEFGVIEHHHMTLEELTISFEQKQFVSANKDPKLVVIPQNGLSIRRLDQPKLNGSKASDHLMRLFYYQEVMNEIGNKYFSEDKNDYIQEEIVFKASKANIVTPLSSLIVLETQEDYDRFGIKRTKNALGNASIGNSGTPPATPIDGGLGLLLGCGVLYGLRKFKSKKDIGMS